MPVRCILHYGRQLQKLSVTINNLFNESENIPLAFQIKVF